MSAEDMKLMMDAIAATGDGKAVYRPPPVDKRPRKDKIVLKPSGGKGKASGQGEGSKNPALSLSLPRGEPVKAGGDVNVRDAVPSDLPLKVVLEKAPDTAVEGVMAGSQKRPLLCEVDGGGDLSGRKKTKTDGLVDGVASSPSAENTSIDHVTLASLPTHFKPAIEVQTSGSSAAPYRLLTLPRALQATEYSVPPFVPDQMTRLIIGGEVCPLDFEMFARSTEISLARMLGIREAAIRAGMFVNEQKEKIKALRADVKKLSADATQNKEKLKKLTAEVATRNQSMLDAQAALATLQGKYDNLKKANDGSENRATQLQNRVNELEQAIKEVEASKIKAEARAEDAEKEKGKYQKLLGKGAMMSFDNAVSQIQLCNPTVDLKFVSPQYSVVDGCIVELSTGGERRVIYEPEVSSENEASKN